jgi:hypothetical protein
MHKTKSQSTKHRHNTSEPPIAAEDYHRPTFRAKKSLWPSWPKWLAPQENTSLWAVMTRLCLLPAAAWLGTGWGGGLKKEHWF